MREVSKYFLCQNNGYKVDGNILQLAFIVLVNNNYKCQLIKFKKKYIKRECQRSSTNFIWKNFDMNNDF